MTIDPTDIRPPAMDGGLPLSFAPPTVRGADPHGARTYRGIAYSMPMGYRPLEMDVHVPDAATSDSPAPVVVWIHGGAWMFGSRQTLPPNWPVGSVAQLLIEAGIAVAAIDYRHAHEAPFPAQLHDAKAAIRYLRHFATDLGLDATRVGVWGESAGGHLAALCALITDPQLEGTVGVPGRASEIAAAVCFYPVTDVDSMPPFSMPTHVEELFMQTFGERPLPPIDALVSGSVYRTEDARRIASAVSHVTASAPPLLLVHGDKDTAVPAQQSHLLADALRDAGTLVDLQIVPGASHVFDGVDPLPLLTLAVDFLSEHLHSRGTPE